MTDGILLTRRAMLTALKANNAVAGLVSAGSIYAQAPRTTPAWPFIRYGSPSATPIKGSCIDGAEVSVAIHGFAKDRQSGGQVVESAEDYAARIGSAIKLALDSNRLTLDGGGKATVRWTLAQLLQDGDEAGAFHSIQNFRVRLLG